MEFRTPNKKSHNKVDQTTYNAEISLILFHMHEIDDMDKECDFGFKEVEEHIYQFKNHQFSYY